MQFNFFQWIREGVRQSVLLGVSDAVDQLGVPSGGDEGLKQLRHLAAQQVVPPTVPRRSGTDRPRRLGRTLKDLEPGETP